MSLSLVCCSIRPSCPLSRASAALRFPFADDWQFERPSAQYFLGDQLNIEASVAKFHHAPLRLFVDHCVATLIPNTNTVPRYAFLDNFG